MFTIRYGGHIYAHQIDVHYLVAGSAASSPSEADPKSAGPSIDDLMKQAREKLDAVKTNPNESYVRNEVYGSWFSSTAVRDILKQVIKMNEGKRADILKLITEVSTQTEWQTSANRKIIEELKASFVVEEKKIEQKKDVAVAKVKTETRTSLSGLDRMRGSLDSTRTKYDGKLNFNDIMAIFKNPESFKKFEAISKNDATLPSSTGDGMQPPDNELMKLLDASGYIARGRYGLSNKNNYQNPELGAILELRDELMTQPKLREDLMSAEYSRSQIVGEYDPNSPNISVVLQHLADLSGDGVLTANNGKAYSENVFFAVFQRVFDGGKDTNLHLEGELPLFNAIKGRVTTFEDLYTVIKTRVNISHAEMVQRLKSKDGFKSLVEEFHRGHLTDTARTTRNVSREFDRSKETRYQIEKADEMIQEVAKIKGALVKEGMGDKVAEKIKELGVNPDGKTVDDIISNTALQLFKFNPRFYYSLGAHASVTDTVTETTKITQTIIKNITIVQDSTGHEVSRTSTTTDGGKTTEKSSDTARSVKLQPVLVVGFNQDIFRYRSETAGVGVQAGVGAVAGVDGVRFPITLSVSGDVTLDNKNQRIQTQGLEGNFVVGGRISLSKDLKSGDIVPSFGVDVNPNDVKNAIEKQEVRLANLLSKIKIDDKGDANFSDLRKEIVELDRTNPNDKKLQAEIRLMHRFLNDLESIMISDAMKSKSPEMKRVLLGNNLLAFQSSYIAAVRDDLKGMHVAGLNVSFIPMISGVFVGLNIQHIQQKVVKIGGQDIVEDRIMTSPNVSLDTLKGKVTLDADKKSLILQSSQGIEVAPGITSILTPEGLTKITPADGKKFALKDVGYNTLEGVNLRAVYIVQIDAVAPAARPKAVIAPTPVASPSAIPEGGNKPRMVYNQAEVVAQLRQANTTEDKLFILSRTNPTFAKAMDLVVDDEFDAAISLLKKDKVLAPFVNLLSNIKDTAQRNKFLDDLLFASSGSRKTRTLTQAEGTAFNAEYAKNRSAFANRLVEHAGLKKGTPEAQRLIEAHSAIASTLTMEKGEESARFVSASTKLPGAKDISGLVTFSQVNAEKKLTVGGLKGFNGDINIVDKTSDITDSAMKDLLIADARRSGVLQSNMESSNAHIKNTIKTDPVPQFDPISYKEFLRTGALPKGFESVSVVSAPQFKMARCALPGAVCFNDVMLLGYPKIAAKPANPALPPVPETPVAIDQSPTLSTLRTGDRTANAGTDSEGTFGFNFSRVINTVTNEVIDNVTREVVNTTIVRSPITQPGDPTAQPPVALPAPTLPAAPVAQPPVDIPVVTPPPSTGGPGSTRPRPGTPTPPPPSGG